MNHEEYPSPLSPLANIVIDTDAMQQPVERPQRRYGEFLADIRTSESIPPEPAVFASFCPEDEEEPF